MKLPLILIFCITFLTGLNSEETRNETKIEQGNPGPAECVEHILKQDRELGEVRNHMSEQLSLSETIERYANSLKSLDYTDCPERFTAAFNDHINAWLDFKKISDKYPGLRGELHVLFTQLENGRDSLEFKKLSTGIWDTWKIVENTAKV